MPLTPPAAIGMPLAQVDTPALIVDLDAFEQNLETMTRSLAGTSMALRPHAKTHKSPIIARQQMARGAVGICCQKVSEAEIMADGGVDDILVSNQIVGAAKLDRLAALALRARVAVCADNADNITEISRAARRFGAEIDVLVEIDVGAGRCGVAPGAAAVALAKLIEQSPGLRFGGLQAYHGSAQHIRGIADRRAAIDQAAEGAESTVVLLREAGIDCPKVTGAGTGTYLFEAASGVYSELQAGSYIFMDADYARNLDEGDVRVSAFRHALFVWATVMSCPAQGRAVVDAGLKSFSVDSGLPEIFEQEGLSYAGASDEHGTLKVADGANGPALGEKLLFVPGHCDPTVNLHDWYIGIRGMGRPDAHVEAIWPVAARGAAF